MNTLCQLILGHLDQARPYMVPESTLFIELRQLTRPVSTDMDWNIAVGFLEKKEFIGHEADELTAEKKFYIKEAGQAVLRRA